MAEWSEERKQKAREAYAKKHNRVNKVEDFNGEEEPSIESYGMNKMSRADKVQSVLNAVKILPPNMVVDGRHLIRNIQAICGFEVTEDMLDEVYEDFSHEGY